MKLMFEIGSKTKDEYCAVLKVIGIGDLGVNTLKQFAGDPELSPHIELVAFTGRSHQTNKHYLDTVSQIDTSAGDIDNKSLAAIVNDADIAFFIGDLREQLTENILPRIAMQAKNLEIISVGVIPKASINESERVRLIPNHFDSLISIPINQNIPSMVKNLVVDLERIYNTITYYCTDFADVSLVLREARMTVLSFGSGKNETIAVNQAIETLAFEQYDLSDAENILLCITSNSSTFKMQQSYHAFNMVKEICSNDLTFIGAVNFDENLDNEVRVTLIATQGYN